MSNDRPTPANVLERLTRNRIADLDITQLSITDVPHLVARAMEMAETLEELPGQEKKQLVVNVTRDIVASFDRENALLWDDLLVLILPAIVDSFVKVNDGKLQINVRSNPLARCLKYIRNLFF